MMEFLGALGDGEGKWQLFVESDESIQVMSLMSTPTGHLTNLATTERPALASDIPGEGIDLIAEFSLGSENSFPTGITFFQNRFYVLNFGGIIYAYTETGERDPDADIMLTYRPLPAFGAQPVTRAVGLGARADRLYVFHEERVRAFTLSGAEDPDATFTPVVGHTIRDMAVGPERFYFVGSRGFGSGTEVLVYNFEHKFQDEESFLKGEDSAEPLAIGFDRKARYLYVINEDHDGAINAYTLDGTHKAGAIVPFSGVNDVGTATIIGDAIYVLDELANKVLRIPVARLTAFHSREARGRVPSPRVICRDGTVRFPRAVPPGAAGRGLVTMEPVGKNDQLALPRLKFLRQPALGERLMNGSRVRTLLGPSID